MCTGGFGRRSLSRPTDLVLLSSTIVRGAPRLQTRFCKHRIAAPLLGGERPKPRFGTLLHRC